jgi:acyl-coenzyme A synthetase/AMP-(fatty) acid ligase
MTQRDKEQVMMWDLKQYGKATALIDGDGREWSYEFLESEGRALAERVGGRGLVFCLCSNTVGSVLGYIAFLNHRIVPVMLDAGLNEEWVENLTRIYRPAYIWRPDASAAGRFGYRLEDTPFADGDAYPLYDGLALLLTTSGSTGSPKFVRQSYDNIRANTESIVEYLGIGADERAITTLPMSYTYGLSILNTHLWAGASVVLQKTLMQSSFWEMFRKFGATSFGGVPYTYEMLDRLGFFGMDLPSLRTMTQAGGKLPVELHRKYAEYAAARGKRFVVMYGQTEATARMSYLPPERALDKIGSMGIDIPGGRLSLIDVDGREITEPGAVGELVYRGRNVTLGYAERGEDLALGDERDGVLETGDMARRDDEGYYYVVGRKKRFLKILGSRVNLDEIERMLAAAFPQAEFACGGVDDRLKVYATDASLAGAALDMLAGKTGFNHSVFEFSAIAAIPRSGSGKILYNELR